MSADLAGSEVSDLIVTVQIDFNCGDEGSQSLTIRQCWRYKIILESLRSFGGTDQLVKEPLQPDQARIIPMGLKLWLDI